MANKDGAKIIAGANELVDSVMRAERAEELCRTAIKEALRYVTQRDLARECGCTPQHLCDVIHGRRSISRTVSRGFLIWSVGKFGGQVEKRRMAKLLA